MSSDSHATITYTSMSSYEAPPSPDYIPGPEYPEYLSPADGVLPAEEQPLPAVVSPNAESPGYITESEPEMKPEEEDGDDEKSEDNFIEYLTSRGDDDADDDGDDLSEDDVDNEEKEESSDSEEEDEEHLALTVPAPALYSFVSASEETEPFEEGETAATPPPFRYRVAARISVQPHILMPFRWKSEVERLLAIPTPPLSPVSPTSYPLPPFLMPLSIFTPLLTSSFPLPSSLSSTSGSESIPKADIPLRKRARVTTPTGGYEVDESSVAAAARQIRLTLTIADRRRADDRLIGILRRERRYFRTLSTTYAQEVAHFRDYCTQIMDYCQSQEVHTRVAAAMAEAEASRVRNGYGSNGSGPRLAQAWFKKMESVFNISNCTSACQVKYAACTLQGVALTWWNSQVKTVTLEVAQALPWKTLKKIMTDKYCPRGEIKKLETELWELKTKGTDVIGYSRCFQELALMCDRMFPKESDRVKKYIGGVPDMIHDSVKAAKPKTMQEAIEFATELMDKRIRDAVENKQKFEGNSDRKMYTGPKPLCSKSDYHHEGPCPPRCNNCKRVGHLTRDCRSRPVNANNNNNTNNNNRNNNNNNQKGNGCYECGAQGHFKRNCPKLRNNNRGDQGGNNNAQARVYVVRNARENPENVVAVLSSDLHTTITYTSMSSYEVIVNGYYGMPIDPLDPYVQLVMEAPPSPDYIPGPEYPEYLPPANDVLPAEEQPLPATVSPTAESPGYITESEPKMEPEEEDGDNKKSEGDSIEYPTSRGDDDGNDLSEDDADDEDEEESSDSEEEEEEHLAPTVPALALYSSVSASEEIEPFEEGDTAAIPPPFGYHVAARIYVQPHIFMPFRSESEVERLLA
nr:hypothetical protein [Tanacetum cinerariifolium]